MEVVSCSFKSIVGTSCSHARRDRSRSREVIPLASCTNDITAHKSSFAFSGVETEKELILVRSGLFYLNPNDENSLTICPFHRSELGVGWIRTSTTTCRVPEEVASHKKRGKADRGIGKDLSRLLYQRTGMLIPVGSGIVTFILKNDTDKKAKSRKHTIYTTTHV